MVAGKKYGKKVKAVDDNYYYIDDLSKDDIDIMKKRNIVVVDPGKYNLAYMYGDNEKKLRYTCSQRDTESLAKRNRRIIATNKKNDKIIEFETKLSKVCGKTVNYNNFKEYIKVKHEINEKVKPFYTKDLYRKLNWRTKTYRQRSEDKFLNKIEETYGKKEDITIAFGDWSRSTQMKGCTSTIGVGLKKLISKKFDVLLLDEYNTSKKCCNCKNNIENKEINGNKKFRLLVCKDCESNIGSSESKCPIFLTRDLNSCINMQNIVKYMLNNNMERPKEFCREKAETKIAKKKSKKLLSLSTTKKKEKDSKSVVFTKGNA
jgi:hypothetical protein